MQASRSRAWPCSAATTTWPSARSTRTRRRARMLDRVARFSVAQVSDGEGIADLRGAWTFEGAASGQEALR